MLSGVRALNALETAELAFRRATAVLEPLGDSRYRLVARLPASAWPQLAER